MAQAAWLELQHWGQNFHCLIGRSVALAVQEDAEQPIEAEPPITEVDVALEP